MFFPMQEVVDTKKSTQHDSKTGLIVQYTPTRRAFRAPSLIGCVLLKRFRDDVVCKVNYRNYSYVKS